MVTAEEHENHTLHAHPCTQDFTNHPSWVGEDAKVVAEGQIAKFLAKYGDSFGGASGGASSSSATTPKQNAPPRKK